MGKRERLDKVLVERGLTASREAARSRILAGEVLVDDRPVDKAGTLIAIDAAIRLKTRESAYVSRGGVKLEKALNEFQIDVRGKTALDVGASTGGFTDCLLARGAARVFAVDVGYGQLDWKLRTDPRVVVFEKTNIRYLNLADLPAPAEIATIDASFISLRLILAQVKTLLTPAGEIVALVKPQFEVGKGKVGKGGVVRSAEEHARVLDEIIRAAEVAGFSAAGVTESPLLGPKGNKEFLLHLTQP